MTQLTMSLKEAKSRLQDRIEKGEQLRRTQISEYSELTVAVKESNKWNKYNIELLKQMFTTEELATEYKKLQGEEFVWRGLMSGDNEIMELKGWIKAKIDGIDSIIERLEIFPLSATLHTESSGVSAEQAPVAWSRKVFIVHGHDEAKKWELKNFLTNLGLEPIVLHEQDDLGKTIIEKFEYYAIQCSFAFVLLTPDDPIPVSDPKERAWRARQNVIMEMGWFMARLGRERVVILHKGSVELPSDVLGVLFLSFHEVVTEVGEKIRQRLKGSGLLV